MFVLINRTNKGFLLTMQTYPRNTANVSTIFPRAFFPDIKVNFVMICRLNCIFFCFSPLPPPPLPLAPPAWLSRHSPIALRSVYCISHRLQLCTSLFRPLLVRYRYHFCLLFSMFTLPAHFV